MTDEEAAARENRAAASAYLSKLRFTSFSKG